MFNMWQCKSKFMGLPWGRFWTSNYYSLAPVENDSYELICVFFLHGVTAHDTFDDARNLEISADQ